MANPNFRLDQPTSNYYDEAALYNSWLHYSSICPHKPPQTPSHNNDMRLLSLLSPILVQFRVHSRLQLAYLIQLANIPPMHTCPQPQLFAFVNLLNALHLSARRSHTCGVRIAI